MTHIRPIFIFVLVLLGSQTSWALRCQHIAPIMNQFLGAHVNYHRYDANIENRTIDQYIKKLDGSKLYLYAKDIKQIRSKMQAMYATKIRKRKCDFLDEIQAIYVKRVEDRTEFASKFLKSLKEIDKKISFTIDPDEREYTTNKKDADAFQAKYMQFQLANIMVTEMSLKEAKGLLERRYLRAVKRVKETTQEDLYASFLDAFARALDPHSSYLSRSVLEDFQINMSLSLEGIGATLSSQDGYTVVEELIPGGAAAASGEMQSQDKILAVAQGEKGTFEPIYDMALKDVVRKIRGKKGTKVKLKILRSEGGSKSKFIVTLVRRKINLEDDAAQITYMKRKSDQGEKKIGVITLPSFYAESRKGGRSSAKDMKKLLMEANAEEVDAIVLDLSSNGGGSLDDAVRIAGLFFRTGNVVRTQGALLPDEDPDVDYAGPLVVLTSRLSASASEIVAGALKDYKRAVVVGGDHTFGKGSVQQVMPQPNQLGAIKVTVGLFYIPGGNSTQHKGVSADIVFPGPFSSNEVGEKTLDYSLPTKSIQAFVSQQAYVSSGPNAWTPLNEDLITPIRKKSLKRVAKNEDFNKIKKDLKEAQNKKNIVSISDIFSAKTNEEQKERERLKKLSRDDRKKEYLKKVHVQEAINIAVDLTNVLNQKPGLVQNKSKSKLAN